MGLETLQDVIETFAATLDVDVDTEIKPRLLAQNQAQINAALRPAFTADTPPDVTAAACRVCVFVSFVLHFVSFFLIIFFARRFVPCG